MFFRIGVLAYNLFRFFTLTTLSPSWHRHQVQTIRWRLYQITSKAFFYEGQVFLKVGRGLCRLFTHILLRIWEFTTAMTEGTKTYLLKASGGGGVLEVFAARVVKA